MRLKPKRLVLFLAFSILLSVTIRFLYAYCYDVRLERHFDQIVSEMDEQQVLSIMGRPDSIGRCGELGGVPGGCYREYLYEPELPTISTWAVFFNERGRLVGKYKYQSP